MASLVSASVEMTYCILLNLQNNDIWYMWYTYSLFVMFELANTDHQYENDIYVDIQSDRT